MALKRYPIRHPLIFRAGETFIPSLVECSIELLEAWLKHQLMLEQLTFLVGCEALSGLIKHGSSIINFHFMSSTLSNGKKRRATAQMGL